ncbi:hypothetical protein ADUPG1_002912, partial [Aduncisulcus paluster]
DWADAIPLVRYLINTQEHSLLGVTPFEMVFGRAPDEWRDLFKAPKDGFLPPSMGNRKTRDIALAHSEALQDRLCRLRRHAEAILKKKDEGVPPVVRLEEGAAVWLLPTKKSSKLAPRLRGPYLVHKNLVNNIISIKCLTSDEVLNVHIRRLVLVKGSHSVEELKNMAAAAEGEYFIEAL